MLIRFLLAVIALSSSHVAWASSEYITRDGNQSYFGDRDSLRRKDGLVRVWVQWVPVVKDDYEFVEGVPIKIDDLKPGSMIQKVLYSFKCTDLMVGTLQSVRYADPEMEEVLESWSVPASERLSYSYVVPGSVGEGLLEWACKQPKAKPKDSIKPKPKPKPKPLRGST